MEYTLLCNSYQSSLVGGEITMVRMELVSIGIVQGTDGTVMVLREVDNSRLLVIGIGPLEASAIAMELQGIVPPRPMTHDLLKNVLDTFSLSVERIVITDLRDNTFFATIRLKSPTEAVDVDSRPSDAIALAVRTGAPIYCEESVLEAAGISDDLDDDNSTLVH